MLSAVYMLSPPVRCIDSLKSDVDKPAETKTVTQNKVSPETTVSDQDVRCAPGLELDIKLTDDKPVQKNYASIPRPLNREVKGYIEDLLNHNFVKPSKSPYSSSCVCV